MEEPPPFVGDWVRKMKLGCGGFGVVTLWYNEKTADSLAIKMCRRDIAHRLSPKQRERWTKEVQIMKNIKHPNIVHTKRIPQVLFEALKEYNISELPILSMEYCSKGSLRHILNQAENCCGLPESEIRFVLEDISSAVAYLHDLKITHRDLKPDNIVLQTLDTSVCEDVIYKTRKNGIIYKLIDLGYAKELDEKSISESFVGTLQYLAPEILLNKSYSNSVDYWSFGLVAFEIICGIRPFLPNMAPAQWLHQIQKKDGSTIRIYQDMDESKSIICSDKMYPENHLSATLQNKLEKWLMVALEYDTKQRGYERINLAQINNTMLDKKTVTFNDIEQQKAKVKDLKFFTLLDSILKTKIITIFVVYTYQILSYEIEEGMQINKLLQKIEKDTKKEVLVNEMVLILPNREYAEINRDDYVDQLWINSFDDPLIHVWKQGCIMSDIHINLDSTPELVKKMCMCPKIKIPGHIMKTFASDCLFYVKKEMQVYDTLIESCNSKIKKIRHQISIMMPIYYDMKTEWILLSRNTKCSKDYLNYDCEKCELLVNGNTYHDKWTKSFENVSSKISTISEVVDHITKRYDSIKRRNDDMNFEKMFRKSSKIADVEKILHEIKQNFEYIRKILNRGDPRGPDVSKNLKKLIISFISVREKKMLKDPNMKKNIQCIIDLEVEIIKIISTMNSAIDNITKLNNELNSINFDRHEDMWSLVSLTKNGEGNSDQRKPEFALYATAKSRAPESAPINVIDDQMLQNLTNSISGNFDYKSIINDNTSLRYMHQDLIQECLDMYKSIMNDHMDFDFLKSDD